MGSCYSNSLSNSTENENDLKIISSTKNVECIIKYEKCDNNHNDNNKSSSKDIKQDLIQYEKNQLHSIKEVVSDDIIDQNDNDNTTLPNMNIHLFPHKIDLTADNLKAITSFPEEKEDNQKQVHIKPECMQLRRKSQYLNKSLIPLIRSPSSPASLYQTDDDNISDLVQSFNTPPSKKTQSKPKIHRAKSSSTSNFSPSSYQRKRRPVRTNTYLSPNNRFGSSNLSPIDQSPCPTKSQRIFIEKAQTNSLDIKILHSIGFGAQGDVYLGEHPDGTLVAIKCLKEACFKQSEVLHLLAIEASIMARLTHPSIVQFRGLFNISSPSLSSPYALVMEYVPGGSLHQAIVELGPLPLSIVQKITKQLTEGLEYLHEFSFLHRDLKPRNVLMSSPSNIKDLLSPSLTSIQIKLSDFGTATRLANIKSEEVVGTPYFIAPEIVKMEQHSTNSDIFSLGSCVYNMISGQMPFQDFEPLQVSDDLSNLLTSPLFNNESRDFILACWQKKPQNRPSAIELLSHNFLTSHLSFS